MNLSDKVYKFLKDCLMIYIPAINTFILSITQIWGLNIPAEQIVASICAFAVMLGGFLKISTEQYLNKKIDASNETLENLPSDNPYREG